MSAQLDDAAYAWPPEGAPAPTELNPVFDLFPALDWEAIWEETTDEEWILEPLISARRLVALYSPPKAGKSLLMLELAAAIATGREALGKTPDQARTVLYVDFENDPKNDIVPRLKGMGHRPQNLGRLKYLSFPTLAALDSEEGGRQLLNAARAYEAEVVVIDTVSRSVQGEENSNDTWLNWYRHTGMKLKADQIAVIRLDHSGKDAAKGQRGGSAKVGDVDAVWRLATVTDDRVFTLECEAHRMPIDRTQLTLHRETSPVLWHRVEPQAAVGGAGARIQALIERMDEEGLAPTAGRDTARGFLRTKGVEFSTDDLAEAIRQRKKRLQPDRGCQVRPAEHLT